MLTILDRRTWHLDGKTGELWFEDATDSELRAYNGHLETLLAAGAEQERLVAETLR